MDIFTYCYARAVDFSFKKVSELMEQMKIDNEELKVLCTAAH